MKEDESERNALMVYDSMCEGILFSLNAGDVYIQHIIARLEKRQVDSTVVENLLSGNRISGHFALRELVSNHTYKDLKPRIETLPNQLIVSSYSALEIYLRNKFQELVEHKFEGKEMEILSSLIESLNFQSLERVKDLYKKILDIHLDCYEIDLLFFTDNPCLDSEATSWGRIRILAKARNEIVHTGRSERTLGEIYPSDSWNLFDFSRQWVHSFDANFNMKVYEGRKPALIQEYEERVREKIAKS